MKTFLTLSLLLCFTAGTSAQTATENVILITMDGLRWQELFGGAVDSMIANEAFTGDRERMEASYLAPTAEERRRLLMPFFWESLAPKGMVFGNRWEANRVDCHNDQWFSYPGYNEILTGRADPAINSNDKIPNPNVTVLEWLNGKEELRGKVVAFGSWDVFDWIVNEERSGIPVNSGYNVAEEDLTEREAFINKLQEQAPRLWGGVRPDMLTHNFALEKLRKDHPRVAFISYGETDDFAHDGSYNRYLDAAHATDAMWRDLWEFLESDPQYAGKTTLLITTDHGRGDSPMAKWKDHGHDYPGSDAIWLAVIGPDTPNRGEMTGDHQLYQDQIATTLAALLGYDYPGADGPEVGKPVSAVLSTTKK
ncbi:type I phosphodiesterase/nucleotide pyrophosphatase [Neolewinella xylanilytica]|uniref:Type I phosphodiesterase/nucleotide pyrophosphatase n=1 Tax=Neolewinella xylanilytica TaxID=1514080 RepID=A0A2S6I7E4_9BACT|nr:alkaline phosphatase family protein [Neolewinella xylanilytica]PPK87378.1 type I phosphodiesterase/nucleotide pyrophosphatase [Neolewinella xylanilytica]